jgi:hypothetical protein
MKRFLSAVLVAVGLAGFALASDIYPLSEQEKANTGANWVWILDYEDFTEATANTAQVFSNFVVKAKQGVEFVALQLDTAFDSGNTNYTGSCAVTVGDGSDADLFLASTELASDGTEVFLKYTRPDSYTIASTPTFQTGNVYSGVTLQTVSLTDTNGTTAACVTGLVFTATAAVTNGTVASTATVGELGRKVYTEDGYVAATFTPNSDEALDDNTSGKVKLYLKVTDAR